MKNIYKLALERHLMPFHIVCATSLGELATEGALNQGNALLAGKAAGLNLAQYVKELAKETGEVLPSDPAQAAEVLIKLIRLSDVYEIEKISDNRFVVKIKTDQCKYCPKGVGGAEISGTVCPFPGVIEAFVSDVTGRKISVILKEMDEKGVKKTPLLKKNGFCVMEFQVD